MGNDGGTIPTRVELVKQKRKPKQVDRDAQTAAKWKHCQITQEALRAPIVACDLGRLYNKDSVLQHLLNKKNSVGVADHIRSIKDVRELALTITIKPDTVCFAGEQGGFYQKSEWICPVTGLEMNGRHPFSFLKPCGCVISERALKALKAEECPNCNKPYSTEDLIPLNPGPVELDKLKFRLELLKERQKNEKKAVKDAKKRDHVEIEGSDATSSAVQGTSSKKPTLALPGSAKHVFAKDTEVQDLVKKSIAKDPNASKVFKSLFTTSDNALKRDHAHWVTYNPYY